MNNKNSMPDMHETFGLLCFGNELLSGKVADANLAFWINELSNLGRKVNLAMIVPDDRPAMIAALKYAQSQSDIIFTSGGIGPTHDDFTLPIIAESLDRKLVRDPRLADAIRSHYKDQTNEHLLRMADVPEGTELLFWEQLFVPLFKVENIYMFPGVPSLMQNKFKLLVSDWVATPNYVKKYFTRFREGEIAEHLEAVEEQFSGLAIGSYPRYDPGAEYSVMVTLESRDRAELDAACAALCQAEFQAGILRESDNFDLFEESQS